MKHFSLYFLIENRKFTLFCLNDSAIYAYKNQLLTKVAVKRVALYFCEALP